jgi:hypothetical protein
MTIKGLARLVKNILPTKNLSEFKGQTAAIDIYLWILPFLKINSDID